MNFPIWLCGFFWKSLHFSLYTFDMCCEMADMCVQEKIFPWQVTDEELGLKLDEFISDKYGA